MATCLSNDSNPFSPSPSFTLKPRAEKCIDNDFLDSAAPLLGPSFGRGLRIRSSFDEDDRPTTRRGDPTASASSTSVEPPSWAVCASGEARLEPVGPTASTHDSIDLSSSACFRVGRSPSSDVRLNHPTSSRKHALIFHHPNGSCYIVDCGSAHGTYVNGALVGGPVVQKQGNSSRATAVPHRVRRGALVRFGGPGAPTFVLKSFPASLEGLVKELCGAKQGSPSSVLHDMLPVEKGSCSPTPVRKIAKVETPSSQPTLSPTTPRSKAHSQFKTPYLASRSTLPPSPGSALVALNTRVNALGGGASLSQKNRLIAQRAASKFVTGSEVLEQIDSCLLGKRARSDDMSCTSDGDYDDLSADFTLHHSKRSRAVSYPFSPDPIRSCMKIHEIPSSLLHTPLICEKLFSHMTVEIFGKNEGRRKVKFQEETEQFYPAWVTPDVRSFDEDNSEPMKQ